MNALPKSFDSQATLRYERMSENHLDEVMRIELDVFPFYWSRDVFRSSIREEGYDCRVAFNHDGCLVGYFVLMKVVDEVHLLTIAVDRSVQGRGWGRVLVDQVIDLARDMGMQSLLLEVRPSNVRALEIYQRRGFTEIGRRKNYYPAPNATREDALVMRLEL